MSNLRIKTPCADVFWVIENKILKIEYFSRSYNLVQAKAHVAMLVEHFYKEDTPLLVLSVTINEEAAKQVVNKDAREYFASEEVAKFIKASALIANNSVSKMVGNLFVNANKPLYPTQIFKTEQDAIDWLKTFID